MDGLWWYSWDLNLVWQVLLCVEYDWRCTGFDSMHSEWNSAFGESIQQEPPRRATQNSSWWCKINNSLTKKGLMCALLLFVVVCTYHQFARGKGCNVKQKEEGCLAFDEKWLMKWVKSTHHNHLIEKSYTTPPSLLNQEWWGVKVILINTTRRYQIVVVVVVVVIGFWGCFDLWKIWGLFENSFFFKTLHSKGHHQYNEY